MLCPYGHVLSGRKVATLGERKTNYNGSADVKTKSRDTQHLAIEKELLTTSEDIVWVVSQSRWLPLRDKSEVSKKGWKKRWSMIWGGHLKKSTGWKIGKD